MCIRDSNRSADLLVISKATMDKLTDEQMAAIQEAADESSLYQRELWAESEKESREDVYKRQSQWSALSLASAAEQAAEKPR